MTVSSPLLNSSAAKAAGALRRRVRMSVFLGLWLLGISWGMGQMMLHENTPGAAPAPEIRWPAGASIAPSTEADYTVVMLAHPRCPCTSASLYELARLNAQTGSRSKTYVLFMLPVGASEEWSQAPNWKLAAEIPGVRVVADRNGRQAELFGAKTSGQTLIYDRAGVLRFCGGLTGARGQEGENPACAAALRLIREGIPPAGPLPVFGCPLRGPSDPPLVLTASARS